MHEIIVIFIKQFKAILGGFYPDPCGGAGSPNAWPPPPPNAPLGHVSSPDFVLKSAGKFFLFLKGVQGKFLLLL